MNLFHLLLCTVTPIIILAAVISAIASIGALL